MSTAKMPPPFAPHSNNNGVITAPPKGVVGGNRKKQKRRAKQAAKQAAQAPPSHQDDTDSHVDYEEDALRYGEDDYEYSENEADAYSSHYAPQQHAIPNGVHLEEQAVMGKKKNKKKRMSGSANLHNHAHGGGYDRSMAPPLPHVPHHPMNALRPGGPKNHHGQQRNIWNTSTQQERTNIKNFWLSLTEDDRKALLKIEKEAVLKKMKQQQKSSCSCTVCGRKRTAIEEELEVLYEGYYEELEQYAHHDHPPLPAIDGLMPDALQHRRPHPLATPPPPLPQHHKPSHMHEHLDEEEYSDDEEYSDEEEEYSDDDLEPEPEPQRVPNMVQDFFNFGTHLQVKGILTPWPEQLRALLKLTSDNLLTVADDLLKNDGRKFIEMMEQLAERRMQRESRSQYEAEHHSGYPPDQSSYNQEDPLADGDEFDDEEASYDSQEDEYDDLEDDEEMVGNLQMASLDVSNGTDHLQGGLTEEQRMQEGRRMFQIFAARMFEQRVLTAYREKVAKERQEELLQDLVNEEEREKAREAKKQRDAQKKKDKKKQQQQAKAEEKARRDAEKAEEEARLREAEEQRQDEQRRKKEEQRRKREEEKRRQDEEKARKEAEKVRRQQEEQLRREEAERKARELKSAEKARKEELRKREREEREAKEREARERKAQEEKEKREREVLRSSRTDREHTPRDRRLSAQVPDQNPPQIVKRPSQMGTVAVPGVFPKQPAAGSGISSPHPTVATPALPKAANPGRPRQASQQNSLSSSPKQVPSQISNQPSKSSSPSTTGPSQIQPKTILQKPQQQQQASHGQILHPPPTTSPMHHQPMMPPPGMSHAHQQHGGPFGGMNPMGFQGFPGPHGGFMHNPMGPSRGPMPMFAQQGPPMGLQNRMPFGQGLNGMPGLPPLGMIPPPGRNFGFDMPNANHPPPGFGPQSHGATQHTSPIGQPMTVSPGADAAAAPRASAPPPHSRQQSMNEKERFEAAASQPIARPAPIQRPSSVKPQDRRALLNDVDDLSQHLGSSALLDDTDDISPSLDNRRHSGAPSSGARTISGPPGMNHSIGGAFGAANPAAFGTPGTSWNTPSLPFGQVGQPSWGSLPTPGINMGGWATGAANGGAPSGAGFGNSHHHVPLHGGPPAGVPLSRPRAIRIAICQACKQLSSSNRGGAAAAAAGDKTDFHALPLVMRQIELNRALPADAPPKLDEVLALCSTEGDSLNGGGELTLRKDPAAAASVAENQAPPAAYSVKWESDQPSSTENGFAFGAGGGPAARGSLGEIGSPMPSKTSLAVGAPGFIGGSSGKIGGISRAMGAFGGPSSPHHFPGHQAQGFFQNLGAVGEDGS